MKQLPKIMVAPNGARKTKSDHPALPITIGEIVSEASQCFNAGADGLHAHVRDGEHKHVLDARLYRELISQMREMVPDMLVQITTEAVGMYSPEQQRKLVFDVLPEAVSVSIAEMTSDSDTAACKRFYFEAYEREIAIQHIIYTPNELEQFFAMERSGIIPMAAHQFLFVLGRYASDQESNPAELDGFVNALRKYKASSDWAACAFGTKETACLEKAFMLGGKARVGFENSFWNADGSRAGNNAERVSEVKATLDRVSKMQGSRFNI
jgi:uncharacterized protein (DUF849 family)